MTIQKKDRPVYHQQLVDYYNQAHPDWTNSKKGNAIWRDLCAIKRNSRAQFTYYHRPYAPIMMMFVWADTPEGCEYWSARNAY